MTGASGKPTIAFQAVVDHNRRILHCSKWFYGTWNDKMITVNDTYPSDLMRGKNTVLYFPAFLILHFLSIYLSTGRVHQDRTYRTYMADGDYKTFGGAWVITDGGYQHVQAFIPPMHDRFTKFEVRVY
jgi:hypothetical protein